MSAAPPALTRAKTQEVHRSHKLKEFRHAFDFVDVNNSGFLEASELVALFRLIGVTKTEAEVLELMKEIDKDADGKVNYDEFVAMMENGASLAHSRSQLESYFTLVDDQGKGYISAERLMHFMEEKMHIPTTLREAQLMVDYADANHDGQLTLDDFFGTFLGKI